MREDIAQILVERPRSGGGGKYPRGAKHGPIEELPSREPAKSRHQRNRKSLNENLAPLRRYLHGSVGRPWNKVYSEVRQRINCDSAVQLHIWQHLMWEVQRDPVRIERMKEWCRSFGCRRSLYVDPRTGLLRKFEAVRRPRRSIEPFMHRCDGRAFKMIDEIWYEITLKPLERRNQEVWDVLLSRSDAKHPRFVNAGELKRVYDEVVYAVRKRQLNTKEIRWLLEKLQK